METAVGERIGLLTKPEERGVLELLRSGPMPAKELLSALSDEGVAITKQGFYKRLQKLVAQGKVLQLPYKERADEIRFSSLFALPQHWRRAARKSGFVPVAGCEHLTESITSALERLRLKLCREPKVEEIAEETGERLDAFLCFYIIEVALAHGWKNPNPKQIEAAEGERRNLLSTASLLKRGTGVKLQRVRSKEHIEKAKRYLELFPDLVP